MSRTRREFIKEAALGAAGVTLGIGTSSAASYSRIMGSNDRLGVAIIGLGRRLGAFYEPIAMTSSNARLIYLCDVMESQRQKAAQNFSRHINYQAKLENDMRKVFEDNDVDVVINATPDHWHAPGTILAVQAGKHVYVEKPGSHNPEENNMLVRARKQFGKVIQLGNQQRSAAESIHIVKRIHEGVIGDPYKAISFYANGRGRTPNQTPAPVPDGLDWELFQGPSPRREYTYNTWDYHWHWYGWDFGTAEIGNNGIHELDIARWALQVDYPERVSVEADKRHFRDDGWTMYDTMLATYNYPGDKVILWDSKSRNAYPTYGSGRGTIIYGTEGSVYVDRDGYRLYDRGGRMTEERTSGGGEGGVALGGGGNMSTSHVVNFFNAVRGIETMNSPIEEMVKSIHLCHLANIAYRTGKSFAVNPHTGDALDRNARSLWGRTYEPGWEPTL